MRPGSSVISPTSICAYNGATCISRTPLLGKNSKQGTTLPSWSLHSDAEETDGKLESKQTQ